MGAGAEADAGQICPLGDGSSRQVGPFLRGAAVIVVETAKDGGDRHLAVREALRSFPTNSTVAP